MKDMFVNYDNDIDRKVLPPHLRADRQPKILESLNNISIVRDALGNEIGVRVKHGTAFSLYFYLDGWVDGASVDALVESSQLVFKAFSFRHKLVFEKTIAAIDFYDAENDCIELQITREEAAAFDLDTYTTSAVLYWPGGSYELFSEKDGLLIFR